MTHIYALTDPRDGRIRYIGKTRQTLKKRLEGHLYPYRLQSSCHRTCWIKGLQAIGLRPSIALLATVPDERANEYEKMYIAQYRKLGYDLTNQTDGGDGRAWPKGIEFSDEHRRRISESKMGKARPDLSERNRNGLSGKTRAKIADAHSGKHLSPENRKKVIDSLNKWRIENPDKFAAVRRSIAIKRPRDSHGRFIKRN